ncbi:MAG: GTP-binding protein [Lachnospiraceae bacterium]|jgi:small GTP-binding protein|nr:GTP-binding protein [Lachnospiraceae bacterium]
MKKLVIGILAHVDAGKTTLAESLLYLTGSIRKLGRVDHKDAFLDTYELERQRGITIFSKQAVFTYKDMEVALLDTPGHIDFSAEMERTLQVLDYAILVISAGDGIQGHTETLWKLLARYRIPTFLFVNKMDLPGVDRKALRNELKRMEEGCVDFSDGYNSKVFLEELAMCDEALLDRYIDSGIVETKDITALVDERKVFPCYFGSALKLSGVEEFLSGLEQFTNRTSYPESFGAKVYKIARDDQGNRLTYMKITGGSLKVKMPLTNRKAEEEVQNPYQKDENRKVEEQAEQRKEGSRKEEDETDLWEEKVDQIRIYSGARYDTVEEAGAGAVCAVTGLNKTYPGEGLGIEAGSELPISRPVLNYQIVLPPECNAYPMLSKLRQLEEEDPQLHILWSEHLKEIHVQLMGEIQVEILKSLILERFGVHVKFGPGNIVYKETIREPVVGVGHFEPLRHYAEVHLLLEPGEAGSGLVFTTNCSEDLLDRNWQRLILTHLREKEHAGVLTGSPITDMKITLLAGRANKKHTEGGDFRQATYRAVRHGLKKAKSVLLEPYYHYKLEIPSDMVGRAMSDIQRMSGDMNSPEIQGEMSLLTGCVPVSEMRGYQTEVIAYTRGRGRLFCTLLGYRPCHNAEEVIEAVGYDSEKDPDNPTGSVFCSHGAGFTVGWESVEDYMHIDSEWDKIDAEEPDDPGEAKKEPTSMGSASYDSSSWREDKELEEIFVRTFGPIKRKLPPSRNRFGYEKNSPKEKVREQPFAFQRKEPRKEYLLVDGYNIIFSWEKLNALAKENMDAARTKLMDILSNYQGFKKCIVILVFDAYKVKGGVGELQEYHNIHVVYTKEAETADQYIEKVTHEIAGKNHVTVATSDALEQLIIMGKGAIRLSANDLREEITRVNDQIRTEYLEKYPTGRAFLGEQFKEDVLGFLEEKDKDS